MPDTVIPSQLRSALFVDFDNIYIGLRSQSEEAAYRFASSPKHWLTWLEGQFPNAYAQLVAPSSSRRILVRRCYANPQTFHKHRPHLIRAGFEVIDTPPLTSHGKTSADIHMVLDVLDALAHPTRFDEFIICSGDADFTPVLVRLRKHDRRTAVLAVGPASGAYMAACDLALAEEEFLEGGLGLDTDDAPTPLTITGDPRRPVLEELENRLFEMVGVTGGIAAVDLVTIYKEFPEFTMGQNWLDFYSLRRMTQAVVAIGERLRIVEDDPWWVGAVSGIAADKAEVIAPLAGGLEGVNESEVVEFVRTEVARADEPVRLSSLGQRLLERFGAAIKEGGWRREGSLSGYLRRLDLGDLRISPVVPGWIFDPSRHHAPTGDGGDSRRERLPEIGRSVCELTDIPPLTSEEIALLLTEIANEINEHGYHLTGTSKSVRDRMNGKGVRIGRAQVNFVLRGISYAGHRLGVEPENASLLGEALVRNTVELLRRLQAQLAPEDESALREWLLGDIEAVEQTDDFEPHVEVGDQQTEDLLADDPPGAPE